MMSFNKSSFMFRALRSTGIKNGIVNNRSEVVPTKIVNGNRYMSTGITWGSNINTVLPMVVEKTPKGDYFLDIFSRLLRERIVLLTGVIDDICSTNIISQLLFLEAQDTDRPIQLCINSPGGLISSGLMQYIKSPITTLCMGQACSMASLLLCAGEHGKRFMLPNSRVMIHQPRGGYSGTASDIVIHANEIIEIRKIVNNIYVEHTKQSLTWIETAMDRDNFMNADTCIKHGIVDAIATKKT